MTSMLSLLDVLPRHERLDIGGDKKIDIFGISGGDIGKILQRFPNAFQDIAMSGSQPTTMNPELLGALIAASQRNGTNESLLGNEEAEQLSRSLAVGYQTKVLQALGRCTFPDGVGPFLEDLVSISSTTVEVMELVVQAATKVQDTGLRPMPKPLEQPDTQTSGI